MPHGAEPLRVIALGGNALSPPGGAQAYGIERAAAAAAARRLAALAAGGHRLLVVHGNGPQVGRLLRSDADAEDLDLHVAQTQGELGYLLAEALERATGAPCAALVTRVLVDPADPAFATATKPIGPLLPARPPTGSALAMAGGWRRAVASPRPLAVVERAAVATLLQAHHVIAGGGGIAIARSGPSTQGLAGVIDKDRVAALLAVALGAQALLFATDVGGVEDEHGSARARLRRRLTVAEAQALLAAGDLGAGSMAPKVESALAFVTATRRPAVILHTDDLDLAFEAPAPGTTVLP